MTRERPILMSAPMIRALLAGTKTQTRRPVKLPKRISAAGGDLNAPTTFKDRGFGDGEYLHVAIDDGSVQRVYCPYAETVGERLWVRENWVPDPPIDDTWASTEWNGCGRVISKVPERFRHPRFCLYAAEWLHGPITWRPSIHMPRWASRITLEVTGVRVERLQDISEADALAEGVMEWAAGACAAGNPYGLDALGYFELLWSSINGRASWDANPWVWIVEFRRTPPRGAGLMREGE